MADANEEQVIRYLKRHPGLLKKHPDLLEILLPPERKLGGGVVDFQHFALERLQKDSRSLKSKYENLVGFCRDNMSIQSQVHGAVLKLVRARSLEQLLAVVTQDLAALFDVDVVRLAMESPMAGEFDAKYGEQNYSGLVLIDPGLTDTLFSKGKSVLLVADAAQQEVPGFDRFFADCAGLIQSFALLRLTLEQAERPVLLAFGVRYKDRFHPNQGAELLSFLAAVIAHQLDVHLQDLDL